MNNIRIVLNHDTMKLHTTHNVFFYEKKDKKRPKTSSKSAGLYFIHGILSSDFAELVIS